jgi:hypothetical protein
VSGDLNADRRGRETVAGVKNHIKLTTAVVVGLLITASCGAQPAFIATARSFAAGTWECTMNEMALTAGVFADGRALVRAGTPEVHQLQWSLDGDKLALDGPPGSNQATLIDVADLEQGTITHTSSSPDATAQLIGGGPSAISNVRWDFLERTVSFQHVDTSGAVGAVASCVKVSEVVTLNAPGTPGVQDGVNNTELTNLATTIERNVTTVAATTWAARLNKDSTQEPDAATTTSAWKTVLGEPDVTDELEVVFMYGDDALDLVRTKGSTSSSFPTIPPTRVQFSLNLAAVCLTPSTHTSPATVIDGACM